METIKYKDFMGSVEVSIKNGCLHGKILFINDLIVYQADNIIDIQKEFEAAIDDYLETCIMLEIEPQKSFSGTFNVRVGEKLHKHAALYAIQNDIKINTVVINSLESYLEESNPAQEIHNHTYNFSFKEPSEKLLSSNSDKEVIHDIISYESLVAAE